AFGHATHRAAKFRHAKGRESVVCAGTGARPGCLGHQECRGMRIAVFGAGLMGHALSLVHALGGHTVRMTDSDPATLARAGDAMRSALATLRDGGEVDASWTDARLDTAATRCATVAETLEGAELIVEAITEQYDAKHALYAEIDALAPMDVI